MESTSHPQHAPSASKRKNIFARRGFQMRFVVLTAGALAVLLAFTSMHGLMMVRRVFPMELVDPVWADLRSDTFRLVLVGSLYIAVVSLAAMFLSHRALGPLGRLEEEIKKMAASGEGSLKVREGDDLEPIVNAINELAGKKKGSLR